MAASGAYPHISRLKLAEALGKHVSTVSNYFSGRIGMPLDVARRAAGLIGVGLDELSGELAVWQDGWAKRRGAKAKGLKGRKGKRERERGE